MENLMVFKREKHLPLCWGRTKARTDMFNSQVGDRSWTNKYYQLDMMHGFHLVPFLLQIIFSCQNVMFLVRHFQTKQVVISTITSCPNCKAGTPQLDPSLPGALHRKIAVPMNPAAMKRLELCRCPVFNLSCSKTPQVRAAAVSPQGAMQL